jgi:hypothetical protein
MVVYCFSLCGHPAGTNEIASPLYRYSRRLRTRLLQVALLHSTGCHLARLHSTRGQVAFLLSLRSSRGGLRGKVGALHTLGTARRTDLVMVMFRILE